MYSEKNVCLSTTSRPFNLGNWNFASQTIGSLPSHTQSMTLFELLLPTVQCRILENARFQTRQTFRHKLVWVEVLESLQVSPLMIGSSAWRVELTQYVVGRLCIKQILLKLLLYLPPCLEPWVSCGLLWWFCHLSVSSNSIHHVDNGLSFANRGAWNHFWVWKKNQQRGLTRRMIKWPH